MDRRTRRQTDVILSSSSSATLSSTVKYATTYINSYGSKSVLPCCYIEAVWRGLHGFWFGYTCLTYIIYASIYSACIKYCYGVASINYSKEILQRCDIWAVMYKFSMQCIVCMRCVYTSTVHRHVTRWKAPNTTPFDFNAATTANRSSYGIEDTVTIYWLITIRARVHL